MRRLFILRKDLHLSGGKLAAMVGHCCEAYWTNLLKRQYQHAVDMKFPTKVDTRGIQFYTMIDNDIWDNYVNDIFTKTICEAKNLNQLKKVEEIINEINNDESVGFKLVEGEDYGYINDKCLTELTPENPDGTCTVGIWFRPLPDDISHRLSKRYKLYRD